MKRRSFFGRLAAAFALGGVGVTAREQDDVVLKVAPVPVCLDGAIVPTSSGWRCQTDYAIERIQPYCPKCGFAFWLAEPSWSLDCASHPVECGGTRVIVVSAHHPDGRFAPCGWKGEAFFSRRQR